MNKELNEMLKEVLMKRTKILRIKEVLDDRKKELENLEEEMVSEMLEQGLKSFKNDSGFLASVTETKKFSITKSNEAAFHAWLKKMGYSDMIKPSVHNQTMQAFFRNEYEDEELPKFVSEFKKRGITIRSGK